MHAIMNTAGEDGLIRRNPCRIRGAGQEYSQERPVVPVGTLVKLLDELPPRYRALVLLATFANLRHATRERDQAIVAGMGKLLSDARKMGKRPDRSGARREKRVSGARKKTTDHAFDLRRDHESGRR
jgi:hypothetical protein